MRTHVTAVIGAVLASTCLAVALPAVAAGAGSGTDQDRPDQRVLEDPRGDMWRMGTDGGYTTAPSQQVDDILRLRVRHTDRAVLVRTSYADLKRVGSSHRYVVVLRTAEVTRSVELHTRPGRWRGRRYFGDTFDTMPCKGVSHEVDYAANTIRIRVPRRCLDSPRWVRVESRNEWWGDNGTPTFSDNVDNGTRRVY